MKWKAQVLLLQTTLQQLALMTQDSGTQNASCLEDQKLVLLGPDSAVQDKEQSEAKDKTEGASATLGASLADQYMCEGNSSGYL